MAIETESTMEHTDTNDTGWQAPQYRAGLFDGGRGIAVLVSGLVAALMIGFVAGRLTAPKETGASAVAVTLRTSFLSSRGGGAGCARVIPPPVDSTTTLGFAGGGAAGGWLVPMRPASPLKRICVTPPRFSPVSVMSMVVPRWIHSGEMDASFGAGWATAASAVARRKRKPRMDTDGQGLERTECVRPRAQKRGAASSVREFQSRPTIGRCCGRGRPHSDSFEQATVSVDVERNRE